MPIKRKRESKSVSAFSGQKLTPDILQAVETCQFPDLHVFERTPMTNDFQYVKPERIKCNTMLPSSKDMEQFNFDIRLAHDEVLPLNRIFMDFEVKIMSRKGAVEEELKTEDKVGFINAFGHTFFSSYQVGVNGKMLSLPREMLPYDIYLTLLTEWEKLEWDMFKEKMMVDFDKETDIEETPAKWPASRSASDRKFRFYCPVMADMFRCPKYLVGGLTLNLRLFRGRNEFCLLSSTADADKSYFIKVESFYLDVFRTKLSPFTSGSLESRLSHAPAIYNFIKKDIRTWGIVALTQKYEMEIYPHGPLPNYLALFMLDPLASKGDLKSNPFVMGLNGLRGIRILLPDEDREIVLSTDIINDPDGTACYTNNMRAIYGLQDISRPAIAPFTFKKFKSGYSAFFFALRGATPLLCPIRQQMYTGRIRLFLNFEPAPKAHVDLITVGYYDAALRISKDRNAEIVIPRGV